MNTILTIAACVVIPMIPMIVAFLAYLNSPDNVQEETFEYDYR